MQVGTQVGMDLKRVKLMKAKTRRTLYCSVARLSASIWAWISSFFASWFAALSSCSLQTTRFGVHKGIILSAERMYQ